MFHYFRMCVCVFVWLQSSHCVFFLVNIYPHATIKRYRIGSILRHANFGPAHDVNEQLLAIMSVILNAHMWLWWVFKMSRCPWWSHHLRRPLPRAQLYLRWIVLLGKSIAIALRRHGCKYVVLGPVCFCGWFWYASHTDRKTINLRKAHREAFSLCCCWLFWVSFVYLLQFSSSLFFVFAFLLPWTTITQNYW